MTPKISTYKKRICERNHEKVLRKYGSPKSVGWPWCSLLDLPPLGLNPFFSLHSSWNRQFLPFLVAYTWLEPACLVGCSGIQSFPIGSMYGIYANIGGILMVNVTIYSIHGSYGFWNKASFSSLISSFSATSREQARNSMATPGWKRAKETATATSSEKDLGKCVATTLWTYHVAMENGPFIDDLPIQNCDVPWFSRGMLN